MISQIKYERGSVELGEALTAATREERFDQDQARDPDGKFASGGSGGDVSDEVKELVEAHNTLRDHPLRLSATREEEATKMMLSRVPSLTKEAERVANKAEGTIKADAPKYTRNWVISVKIWLGNSKAKMDEAQKAWDRGDAKAAAGFAEYGLMAQHQAIYTMAKALIKERNIFDGHLELRDFNPDQPRDAHGRFGSGGSHDPSVPAPDLLKWQSGEHTTMQAEAMAAIKNGTADKDPLINAIRNERFDGQIYRGMALEKGDPLMSAKSGEVVQLEPSSFSQDRNIAVEFSMLTFDPSVNPESEGMMPVVIACGPWGQGIVVGERGDPEYGPKGYDQKEVITGGRFRVAENRVKIGMLGNQRYKYRFISMRQEGTF